MTEELKPCPICGRRVSLAPASIHCGPCNYGFGAFPTAHLTASWNKLPRQCKHEWSIVKGEGYGAPSSMRCIKCGSRGEATTSG